MEQKEWRNIMREWNQQFPFLKPFGNSQLFYRTEFVLIGLCFDRFGGRAYRIYFVVTPLWVRDNDLRRYSSIFRQVHYPRKKYNDFSVDYDKHDEQFPKSVEVVKQQVGEYLSGRISYGDLIKESENDPVPGLMHRIEFKLTLAVLFDDRNVIHSLLKRIDKLKTVTGSLTLYDFDSKGFCREVSVRKKSKQKAPQEWVDKMHYFAENRSILIDTCHENSQLSYISKLNEGVLESTPPSRECTLSGLLNNIRGLFQFYNKR